MRRARFLGSNRTEERNKNQTGISHLVSCSFGSFVAWSAWRSHTRPAKYIEIEDVLCVFTWLNMVGTYVCVLGVPLVVAGVVRMFAFEKSLNAQWHSSKRRRRCQRVIIIIQLDIIWMSPSWRLNSKCSYLFVSYVYIRLDLDTGIRHMHAYMLHVCSGNKGMCRFDTNCVHICHLRQHGVWVECFLNSEKMKWNKN